MRGCFSSNFLDQMRVFSWVYSIRELVRISRSTVLKVEPTVVVLPLSVIGLQLNEDNFNGVMNICVVGIVMLKGV